MKNYEIKETKETVYKTSDGYTFQLKEDAYDHICCKYAQDIVEGEPNTIDIEDDEIFKANILEFYTFTDKEKLDMFIHGHLNNYYVRNSNEILKEVKTIKEFPCILVIIDDNLFTKKSLVNKIKNVLNEVKEAL